MAASLCAVLLAAQLVVLAYGHKTTYSSKGV
jgi:hypothetical protein